MKKILGIILTVSMLISVISLCFTANGASKNPISYGDMDVNNKVEAADALIVLQGSVKKITLGDEQEYYADVDLDNQVTAADALTILQYVVNKIDRIPVSDFDKYDNLLVDTSKALIDTGAYSRDVTADTSFQITTEGLEANTIYMMTDSVYSVSGPSAQYDAGRFVICLQGLINRDYGITHTSLLFLNGYDSTTDNFWYRYLQNSDQFGEYNVVRIKSFESFFVTFKNQIAQCGYCLWDSDVPATSNVAQTICGIEGCLPVRYDTQNKTFYNTLLDLANKNNIKLEEKHNLVGMFESAKKGTKIVDTNINSTGSSKCDAYLWAMDKYMARCSTRYMAYFLDGAVAIESNPLSKNQNFALSCIVNLDYLIARRCFFFDLDAFAGESPCDDTTQDIGTDADTLVTLLSARYDRANGNFGQMMGFPPWWAKYTTYIDRGAIDPVALEWLTVEFNTCFNMSKEADAASPQCLANCSAYYKWISTSEKYENNPAPTDMEYDPDTYYYMIYLGDYDSSAWLAYYVARFWSDSSRGLIASSWAYNPNLSERVPMVFDYIYQNKLSNDYIMTCDSGAGYVYPNALLQGHKVTTRCSYELIRNNPTATVKYANYARPYYRLFDMDVTGFILDCLYKMDSNILDCYNDLSPVGSLFMSTNEQSVFKYNGTVYSRLTDVASDGQSYYNAAIKGTGGTHFSAWRTVVQSPTTVYKAVKGAEDLAREKGKKLQYLDMYTYFGFASQASEVKEWNGR